MANKPQPVVGFNTTEVLGEMIFDTQAKSSRFIVHDFNKKTVQVVNRFATETGESYVPYSPSHSLVKNSVLRLPSEILSYGNDRNLIDEIKGCIHKYVDLSPVFEIVATHYILLSWIQDCHDILPYLRIRGGWGSGKTRFLSVIGSLCYRALFVSGAASVAALFRMLNDVGGTLILDEGDFTYTNEKAEIVKIFNNGNAKGFPVLRCEKTNQHTFEPRSYNIFGAKILASRGRFDDDALESRFLTEEAGMKRIRDDIPLGLDDEFYAASLRLRNKLLAFRFDHYGTTEQVTPPNTTLSNRSLQIITPLLKYMNSKEVDSVIEWLEIEDAQSLRDQAMELPSQLLLCIKSMQQKDQKLQIGEIRKELLAKFAHYHDYAPSAHTVGKVIRTQLQLKTKRTGGIFVIPKEQYLRIDYLYEKFGLDQ